MRFVACRLAYDGSGFHGSQLQKNAFTVQQALEEAIEKVCGHPARIILAGRTDSGVHALGQCFRFATSSKVPVESFPAALNANLDKKVRVGTAREVEEDFHPRFSARSRTYRYWIENAPQGNVLLAGTTAHCREPLDVAAMQNTARLFLGRHDFKAWQSAGSPTATTVRCVQRLEIRRRYEVFGSTLIEVEIQAEAFLYRMVRNIVGTLMAVGKGELTADTVPQLMRSGDRRMCPPPAPPQGLCLLHVEYQWADF